MKLSKIVKELELEVIAGYEEEQSQEVKGVYIGDLLSLVMGKAKADDLWITVQSHVNVVAVASLVELSGIIIVEDMEIDEDTIEKAREIDLPIFKTKLSAYKVASTLHKLGI